MRYDSFDTFGDTVNPRLALIFSPVDADHAEAPLRHGVPRAQRERIQLRGRRTDHKVNPDLEPEKISTYELVCEQRLGRTGAGRSPGS